MKRLDIPHAVGIGSFNRKPEACAFGDAHASGLRLNGGVECAILTRVRYNNAQGKERDRNNFRKCSFPVRERAG